MCRQTTVAKIRSRDYNPVMYIVNASSILPKHKAKKSRYQKKGMINYREKKRWPSFQHMYLPCWLHSHSTFCVLIKSALLHHMQNHRHHLSVLWSDPLLGRHWWLLLWAEALHEGAKDSSCYPSLSWLAYLGLPPWQGVGGEQGIPPMTEYQDSSL